eukprot:3244211-Lingulodinium_polyedra.AAC.1
MEQWTRAVTPPVRFSAVAMAEDRSLTDIRLSLRPPHSGHEQYWLVYARGEVRPAEVEALLGRRWNTQVRAASTIAHNPHTGREEEAILLR